MRPVHVYLSFLLIHAPNVFALQSNSSIPELSFHKSLPRTIYQFEEVPTWIENIHTMRNGSILATLTSRPELHMIDPLAGTATLLHQFPHALGLSGVTEPEPNIFVVLTGNYSISTAVVDKNSYSAWRVDLRSSFSTTTARAKVTKIVDFGSDAYLPNGITALSSHTVLISDSLLGHILKLNVQTGEHNVVITHPSMAPNPNASVTLGVNGLKLSGEWLYYTNCGAGSLHRVKISPSGFAMPSSFATIATDLGVLDDFDVTDDGTVFGVRPFSNEVFRISPSGTGYGKVVTVLGDLNSTVVAGGTSVKFGRTWWDRGVAYVGTNGRIVESGKGTFVEGGKVVGVDVVA